MIPVYRGVARQRGHGLGSIFRAFAKTILPIVKSPLVRNIASKAVNAAVNIGRDVAGGKRKLGDAFLEHGGQALGDMVSGLTGSPKKRRPQPPRRGGSANPINSRAGRGGAHSKRVLGQVKVKQRGRGRDLDIFD